jgi:hypothetical protein
MERGAASGELERKLEIRRMALIMKRCMKWEAADTYHQSDKLARYIEWREMGNGSRRNEIATPCGLLLASARGAQGLRRSDMRLYPTAQVALRAPLKHL